MSIQQTLSMEDTLISRKRPDTFRWCHHCEGWILRSRWQPHDQHDWQAQKEPDEEDEDDEDGDGPPEWDVPVGSLYDITISFSVDYRFRVPAINEHRAEEIAKEWSWDTHPSDRHHVHTDRRKVKEISIDELPDDFDPYGGERLVDAIERMGDDQE